MSSDWARIAAVFVVGLALVACSGGADPEPSERPFLEICVEDGQRVECP